MLLHNGNKFACVPIRHFVIVKEHYVNVKMVFQKLCCYSEHNWVICVDYKRVNFLLEQQGGYTKHSCFLCYWDSHATDQHWVKKDWLAREDLTIGDKNVNKSLVNQDCIILPLLHIKLGLMKQFVKALDKDDDCFNFIPKTFPALSMEKFKNNIFDGLQIHKLMQDQTFTARMTVAQRAALCSYVSVI